MDRERDSVKNIFICAKAGAGKSACADYLKNKGYLIARFSYPVYEIGYNYFNMDRLRKDRGLLQVIGTDAGRYRIDNDIWVKRLLEDISIADKTKDILHITKQPFCCDDVRFINEYKALSKADWLGIYLDVSDETRIARLKSRDNTAQIKTLNHVSETAIDEFKHELVHIDANGSLQEMYDNLEKVICQS